MARHPGIGPEPIGVVVIGEARRHYGRLAVRIGLFFAVGVGLGVDGVGGWRYGGGLLALVWAPFLVIAVTRVVRPGPQLVADAEGVRAKNWRGWVHVRWADVTMISPLDTVVGPAVRRHVSGRVEVLETSEWRDRMAARDEHEFRIRYGPRTVQMVTIYEDRDMDVAPARTLVHDLWTQATGRPKARPRTGDSSYVLSGFADGAAVASRTTSWDSSEDYGDVDEAVAAAGTWIEGQGPDATVEVISMVAGQGYVVRVVSRNGVETIQPA